jgi:hypothetical protein
VIGDYEHYGGERERAWADVMRGLHLFFRVEKEFEKKIIFF